MTYTLFKKHIHFPFHKCEIYCPLFFVKYKKESLIAKRFARKEPTIRVKDADAQLYSSKDFCGHL